MIIILFFSDIPWEGLYQRPHHIAKRLSNDYTVIWIEPITMNSKNICKLLKIKDNLFSLKIPALPYNARNQIVRILTHLISRIKFIRSILTNIQSIIIKKVLNKFTNGLDDSYIFFFENFQLSDITSYFNPKLIIYDYIDNAFGFTKLPKHVEKTWQNLIKQSNFIITTSKYLNQQIKTFRKEDVYLVSNGVEYNFFSQVSTQLVTVGLTLDKKIIGYVGAIYPWIDFEIIEYLCDKLLDYNIVLIGKAHPQVKNNMNNLKRFKNFIYLGFKNYTEIPHYLSKFSVAIIPFKKNELTEGVNPVKLFEYSAAGIPTVTTYFSDELNQFSNFIFISNSKEEFVTNINKAIGKSGEVNFINKIKNFAKENDWDEKYKQLNQLIIYYLNK